MKEAAAAKAAAEKEEKERQFELDKIRVKAEAEARIKFELEMKNKAQLDEKKIKIEAEESDKIGVITQMNPIPLKAGQEKNISFFLKFPKSVLVSGRTTIKVNLLTQADDGKWERRLTQEVPLAGPF